METRFNEEFVYPAVLAGELEIDSDGRIWRVMRKRQNNWAKTYTLVPCKRVRAEAMNDRYLQVKVMKDGVRKYAAAHRLVWRHVNGPIPPGKTVNHIDGVTTNNRPQNLELATHKEQTAHAYAVLKRKRAGPRENCRTTHLTPSDVRKIRTRAAGGESLLGIARGYNISRDAAYRIVTRRSWNHIP